MKGKIFIDTNILVYSLDENDKNKKNKSRSILNEVYKMQNGVISTQVINEFFVVTTKKLKADPLLIKQIIGRLEYMEIVNADLEIIKDAIDISILNKLSYWDSLIISCAASAKCSSLYTEDLNNNQLVLGIRIINPFI